MAATCGRSPSLGPRTVSRWRWPRVRTRAMDPGLRDPGTQGLRDLSTAGRLAEHDPHLMRLPVADDGYGGGVDGDAVERRLQHASALPLGVRHPNQIPRALDPPPHLLLRPAPRHPRADAQRAPLPPTAPN